MESPTTGKSSQSALTDRVKKFADLHLSGMPAGRAYTRAGYTATGNSAEAAACRMLRNVQVSAYIAAERKRMAAAGEIARDEIVGFLAKVIRTPIGEVTAGSRLAQEYHEETTDHGTRKRVKMIGKMDAVRQLCSMMGWNAPAVVEVAPDNALLGLLTRIRSQS